MSLALYYYLAITAVYILMSWSFYLPYRMGQLHFLTVANMAVSAYFAGMVSLHLSWPFWLILFCGVLIAGLTGFLVSLAVGDAPCFSVVVVGFTFIYLVKTLIENVEFFGGTLGVFNIPAALASSRENRMFLLGVIWGFVLMTGFFIARFDSTAGGRAVSVIFTDRSMAAALGVNVKNMGIFLQTWASAIGGVSGVMYAYIMRSLSPNYFTFQLVGICMTILFVGGHTTLWGTLLAAPLLWGFSLILPEELQSWSLLLYGILLVGVLLVRPEGLVTRRMILKWWPLTHKSSEV